MPLYVCVQYREELGVLSLNKVKPLLVTLGGVAMAEYVGAGVDLALSIYSALSFCYFFDKKKVNEKLACVIC